MNGTEWIVVVGAVAAIAWINWYFFVAGRKPAQALTTGAAAAGGVSEIVITVDGGYSPNAIRAKAGRRVRLVFDRKDDSSCSEEIVLPDFGIRRYLPTGQRTAIEFTPAAAGRYSFTCGMSMLRGTLLVEE